MQPFESNCGQGQGASYFNCSVCSRTVGYTLYTNLQWRFKVLNGLGAILFRSDLYSRRIEEADNLCLVQSSTVNPIPWFFQIKYTLCNQLLFAVYCTKDGKNFQQSRQTSWCQTLFGSNACDAPTLAKKNQFCTWSCPRKQRQSAGAPSHLGESPNG